MTFALFLIFIFFVVVYRGITYKPSRSTPKATTNPWATKKSNIDPVLQDTWDRAARGEYDDENWLKDRLNEMR